MVKAWKETVVIPTYEVGRPEKNPIFLEKRVYQGSSGVVYPYPVTESVADKPVDHAWNAVYIENEYIKVMILPELGGRVQMAYDKVCRRHFIYYNHVIKPALVGLAGPWISGGIEFNWPQHHRPSTYMPVETTIEEHADGSVTVWVNERERMFHQRGMAGFTLRPGCARLEIKGALSNPTDMPQTFLWWANPAVAVGEHYRSIFPPDVNAVFDHGKRAVSSFPVATGTYYKMDYSAGVDIACYKNIEVPTSYMVAGSRFDFEGGYDDNERAGMLHVANHRLSPGKKQWTWGNGDFGHAWDRCLTDDDGPYIELMAGVYTENQPDFAWLMPGETKEFTQYFLPYRELPAVKNASKDLLLDVEQTDGSATVKLYATRSMDITIVVTDKDGMELSRCGATVNPEQFFEKVIALGNRSLHDIRLAIFENSRQVMEWEEEPDEIRPVPDPATAAALPEEIKTVEQLYLTGVHLEQYRHATYSPTDYYEEGLRRDPDDIRCNTAMGLWLIRNGRWEKAVGYLERAVKASTRRNPNPRDGEPLFCLGVALKRCGRFDEAYDRFFKATWNAAWQDAAYMACAQISCRFGRFDEALEEIDRSLARNWFNSKSRALKAALLRRAGRHDEAVGLCRESLIHDRFNHGCLTVLHLEGCDDALASMKEMMHADAHCYDETALDFCEAGLWDEALTVWEAAMAEEAVTPMTHYFRGWALSQKGNADDAKSAFAAAAAGKPDYVFPNRPEAVLALRAALETNPDDAMANHYLGNLFYDRRQTDLAEAHWTRAAALAPQFPGSKRNLALLWFNKHHDGEKARMLMEEAFALDRSDARVLMELDQLCKKLQHPHDERLALLQQYPGLVTRRDDLVLEEITLLNLTGRYAEAIEKLDARIFHPWEGGEGKVPFQYQTARVELAKSKMAEGNFEAAVRLLEECLVYPHNLGEGKLRGAQDNDFHYLLGLCHKALGLTEEAQKAFMQATDGPTEPAAALYYNDAKPDKIFYAGLAFRALGNENKARAYFNRLVSYGKQHLHDRVTMDYFAVSLPDLQVWDGSLDEMNRIHCLYMLALGYAGLGDKARSNRYLAEARAIDINHQGLRAFDSFEKLAEKLGSF